MMSYRDYRRAVDAAEARGIAVQPLSPRQVSQAQQRLNRLYSGSREPLQWIIVRGLFVFGLIVVPTVMFYGWMIHLLLLWMFG